MTILTIWLLDLTVSLGKLVGDFLKYIFILRIGKMYQSKITMKGCSVTVAYLELDV